MHTYQDDLHAVCYRDLTVYLNLQNVAVDGNAGDVGHRVILPSTFFGEFCYQDTMAMVRKFGKPDLFIIFTCNPGWPDIDNLSHETRPSDRLDIVARVFNMS